MHVHLTLRAWYIDTNDFLTFRKFDVHLEGTGVLYELFCYPHVHSQCTNVVLHYPFPTALFP
jgi:hypothetical protein